MRADRVEDFVSLAAALSLLASLKSRSRRPPRARKQVGPGGALHDASLADSQSPSPEPSRDARTRYWRWLDHAIVGSWIAMLLSVIAYALVEGEEVMAQLDGLDLVTAYSLLP